MSEICKGVRGLYEKLIQFITDDKENLYEWIFDNPNEYIVPRQLQLPNPVGLFYHYLTAQISKLYP